MASNEKSELDKCDDTEDLKNTFKVSKSDYIKRDNNLEVTEIGGNQRKYGSRISTRHEHQQSGINGNWRTKCDDDLERNIQKSWISNRGHKETSENPKLEAFYSQNEINGYWRILSIKWEESKDFWNAVEKLHIEQPRLFPVPPIRLSFNRNQPIEAIMSWTSPSCGKAEIKEAADAIRKKVNFSFVMLYFEGPFERNNRHKYQHTPENEFYELENNLWKIALSEQSLTACSGKSVSSNKDANSEDSDVKSYKTDLLKINKFAPNKMLPSEVMDQEYLYFPSTQEAITKMRSSIGGKWLVHGGFSLAEQDSMWTNLLPLCTEGILTGIKASTTMITDAQESMSGEAILCYTADANDMNDVKKAADAIRSVLENKYIFYYKTNAASEEGRYIRDGRFSVTSYMHTVKGTFYARDQYKRWTLTEL